VKRVLYVVITLIVLDTLYPSATWALGDQLYKWVRSFLRPIQYHVVLIGINEYINADRLSYAVNDDQYIASLFQALGYKLTPESMLLRDTPEDPHVTRQRIRANVRAVLQSAGPDDAVIVFFAGHGRQIVDWYRNAEAYLLTSDFDPHDISGTALSFQDLVRLALEQGVKAKHVLFILDACYAGDALNLTGRARALEDVDDSYIQYLLDEESVSVITAGDEDQKV
jgi:uncharacterized caspase-like protein